VLGEGKSARPHAVLTRVQVLCCVVFLCQRVCVLLISLMHKYHHTVPESRKVPILEITLSKVLEGLDMDMAQFIDLCILMGCDYCGTIKGCGPKTAQVCLCFARKGVLVCARTHIPKHGNGEGCS